MSIYTIDTEDALIEEIVSAAVSRIETSFRAFDAKTGDEVGIVYFDGGMNRYYAANIDSLRSFIRVFQEVRGEDAFSLWCAETDPEAEAKSAAEVLSMMGWTA